MPETNRCTWPMSTSSSADDDEDDHCLRCKSWWCLIILPVGGNVSVQDSNNRQRYLPIKSSYHKPTSHPKEERRGELKILLLLPNLRARIKAVKLFPFGGHCWTLASNVCLSWTVISDMRWGFYLFLGSPLPPPPTPLWLMPKRMQTWKWIVFGRIKCTMTFSIAEMRDHVESDDDEWSGERCRGWWCSTFTWADNNSQIGIQRIPKPEPKSDRYSFSPEYDDDDVPFISP